mgnify:CR=1 FL=1
MVNNEPSANGERLTLIQSQLVDLKGMVTENTEILKGKGSNCGVVGNLKILAERFSSLESIMNNDLKHLQAKIDISIQQQDALQLAREKVYNEKAKQNLTWTEVLKEWLKPVIVALIVASASYFLFH